MGYLIPSQLSQITSVTEPFSPDSRTVLPHWEQTTLKGWSLLVAFSAKEARELRLTIETVPPSIIKVFIKDIYHCDLSKILRFLLSIFQNNYQE